MERLLHKCRHVRLQDVLPKHSWLRDRLRSWLLNWLHSPLYRCLVRWLHNGLQSWLQAQFCDRIQLRNRSQSYLLSWLGARLWNPAPGLGPQCTRGARAGYDLCARYRDGRARRRTNSPPPCRHCTGSGSAPGRRQWLCGSPPL